MIARNEGGHKPKDLYGLQIDACARVMSLAKAGQVLMTRAVFDSARQVLKGEDIKGIGPLEWLNHGPYLLKGLDEPIEVCEVREAGNQGQAPPTSSDGRGKTCGCGVKSTAALRPFLPITVLTFSADGQTLITRGDEGTTRWWQVATGREMLLFQDCHKPITVTASSASAERMLVLSEAGRIRVMTMPTLAAIDAAEKGGRSRR